VAKMAEVIGNSELANRALAAQVASRLRPAIATDAMLVTPIVTRSHSDTPEFNAVGVLEMSRDQIAKAQEFLRKKAVGRKYKEGISEQVARQVLELQSSRCMTNFSIAKTSNTKYLPGGVPLIDHLHVRVDNSVDWKCLVEPIDALRHHRLPRSSDISAVKEFTLGHSEERHVHAALEYLKCKIEESQKTYIIVQLAADTESIGICREDYHKILHGRVGETHTATVPKGGSADPFPVLLMVGHVGWQVRVKLPAFDSVNEKGERQLTIEPGKLQEKAIAFFRELKVVTGVDIREDLREFFDVVKSLYGVDLWEYVPPPLELDVLARLAGYNLTHYSVVALNWVIFGTLLPKGLASLGDRKWNHDWADLPRSLQDYLSADISQVAGVSWVMTISWILQIFPDAHAVTQVSTLSQTQLVEWWQKFVVENMLTTVEPVRPWQYKFSRREIMETMANGHQHRDLLVGTTADWPSYPAGGARFIHTARAFLLSILPMLRSLDEDSWPLLQPEQYHTVVFGRFQVKAQPSPTDAVRAIRWVPNPDIGPRISGSAMDITLSSIQQTIGKGLGFKAAVMEYSRLNPHSGLDLLTRVESNKPAMKLVFGFRARAQSIVTDLRNMLRTFDMMPERPPNWVDPFQEAKKKEEKITDLAQKALSVSRDLKRKADLQKIRAMELKIAAKEVKKRVPERTDHSCNLVTLMGPKVNPETTLSRDRILSIGERTVPNPPKKSRLAETATSGAFQETMTIERTIRYVDTPAPINPIWPGTAEAVTQCAPTQEYGAPQLAVNFLSVDPPAGLADPGQTPYRFEEWRPNPSSGILEGVANIHVVGFSHAMRLAQGLRASELALPVNTNLLEDWNYWAIEQAAQKLTDVDLTHSLVLLWLHDDQVFEHAGSGDLLVVSDYDGRLHCDGVMGVTTQSKMKNLWDQSMPLIEACKKAMAIVLITPLPKYITAPCCELVGHCLGYQKGSHFSTICREVASLHEVTMRWVSRIDNQRLHVFTPHLEMRERSISLRQDWEYDLKESYSLDGVHLTRDAYLELACLVWNLTQNQSWKLRPPVANMPSPHRGPDRVRVSHSRAVHNRLGPYVNEDSTHMDAEDSHERIVVFCDSERIVAERGPWANSEIQYQGSPVNWDIFRETTTDNSSSSSRCPPGLRPG